MKNQEFNSLTEFIKKFNTEQKCINYLEQIRWNGNIVSPFDSTSQVYKCRNNRYRCKNTNKDFNVKTNTLFEGSKRMTDKLTSYFSLYENYNHYTITHRKSYVRGRGGQIHTNTIEGLWSLFKRGILGSYHFTTEEHLQKYLNEFCFRYNTKNYSKKERFDYFLKNIENK